MNNYKPAMKQDVVVLRFVGYIKGDDLSCDITCQPATKSINIGDEII